MQPSIQVQVSEKREEAVGIVRLRLVSVDPLHPMLPFAAAGSHVDLLLDDKLIRSYSLYKPSDGTAYELAIQLEPLGRGGSRYVHEKIQQGQRLAISHPRNNFPLREHGNGAVLIAGGIGITPVFAMLQTLVKQGKNVHLIYCARSRQHAAFMDDLTKIAEAEAGVTVTTIFEDTAGKPDLLKLIAEHGPAHDYYCCGPAGMLSAFETACTSYGYTNHFVERFAAAETVQTQVSGYEVKLARSKKVLQVPAGRSLLEVLLEARIDIAYSCQEGVCGSCETAVLAGELDHRDGLLSEDERKAGNTMLVCVSGCKSSKLVLDL